MHVKRNTLLLLACLVWSAAGFNILRIGLMAYPAYLTVLNALLSVLVFAVFKYFIFGKLVKKHTARNLTFLPLCLMIRLYWLPKPLKMQAAQNLPKSVKQCLKLMVLEVYRAA